MEGFVYVYKSEVVKEALEVSYAKKTSGSAGIASPALKLACQAVGRMQKGQPRIVAEIEFKNVPSVKVAEKVGFERIEHKASKGNGIWELNWKKMDDFGLEKVGFADRIGRGIGQRIRHICERKHQKPATDSRG